MCNYVKKYMHYSYILQLDEVIERHMMGEGIRLCVIMLRSECATLYILQPDEVIDITHQVSSSIQHNYA
jgi:hypothetical protein